jgi:hypothetical protein
MTFAEQVCDVVINKSFKADIRSQMRAYMRNELFKFTRGGKIQKAPYTTICEWVVNAVETLRTKKTMIKQGFEKCGFDYQESGDPNKLNYHLRSVVMDALDTGYQVLPSAEEAQVHNEIQELDQEEECFIGSDEDSEIEEIASSESESEMSDSYPGKSCF